MRTALATVLTIALIPIMATTAAANGPQKDGPQTDGVDRNLAVSAPAYQPTLRWDAVTPVPQPPQAPKAPADIESLSPYLEQVSCDVDAKPGAIALGDVLRSTYPGTSYSVARDCGADGMASEHYEGRAVDWFTSVRDPLGAARAQAVIDWLLASDSQGRSFANARRLGVMYIIWNNRLWGSYSGSWRAYSNCASRTSPSADTGCHRDHIHISLSWAGAMKRTSYWTGRVAPTDYGPCAPVDLNWAAPYSTARSAPCPDHVTVTAPAGASAALVGAVRYSGAEVDLGSHGPVVSAVQRSLGVNADGGFGPLTQAAVQQFQRTSGIPAIGHVGPTTWRALLARLRSKSPTPVPAPSPPSTAGPGSGTGASGSLTPYAHLVVKYGDRGPAVLALQRSLRLSQVSGWFGPMTQSAVIALQKSKGLTPDGVVGPLTWKALGA